MQTTLAPTTPARPKAPRPRPSCGAACIGGFCTATCPTYQLLGDELDGPRGRIYLIKQVMEGQPATRETQLHLDRCLTCRNWKAPARRAWVRAAGRDRAQRRGRAGDRPAGERLKRGC